MIKAYGSAISSPFGGAGTPSGVTERVKPSPWGRWLDAKRQDGRGSSWASVLALSVFASQIHLSQRERPWHNGKVSDQSAKLTVSPEALPLGELSPQVTERARTLQKGKSPAVFMKLRGIFLAE